MPLRIRPVVVDVDVPVKEKSLPVIRKGKEKVGQTVPVEEPWKEVVYDRRSIVPFKPDVW